MRTRISSQPEDGRSERWLLLALLTAVALRLLSLGLYPLNDTTEARYAEVARKMVELGDWVTPWYDYGVPFWAKPPLSTWVTAASFKVFGVNEFAARLPHFLLALALAWLIWDWVRRIDRRQALLTVCLLAGAILFLVSSGAVMTDMALALGTTMAMRGLWLAMHGSPNRRRAEATLAFVGLAVGLLAKGPVALVIAGLPFGAWMLATRNVRLAWQGIPWLRGTCLVVALSLPWYLWAEHATPGFLEYFLVGEHWHRFTTPSWAGDRYGNAHEFARGTIWLFAAVAFLPWSVLLPLAAIGRRVGNAALQCRDDRDLRIYLFAWALAPCVFFALARNIIWTYALPAIPAAAILGAAWLHSDRRRHLINAGVAAGTVLAVVMLSTLLFQREVNSSWKSTRDVVKAFDQSASGQRQLVFLEVMPYSASFYSNGRARLLRDVAELKNVAADQRLGVVVSVSQAVDLSSAMPNSLKTCGRYGRYVLLDTRECGRGDPALNNDAH